MNALPQISHYAFSIVNKLIGVLVNMAENAKLCFDDCVGKKVHLYTHFGCINQGDNSEINVIHIHIR